MNTRHSFHPTYFTTFIHQNECDPSKPSIANEKEREEDNLHHSSKLVVITLVGENRVFV
jgi:hypothetical protein